jgi:hypothetical protein
VDTANIALSRVSRPASRPDARIQNSFASGIPKETKKDMNRPYYQRNGLRAAAVLALTLVPAALTAPAAHAQLPLRPAKPISLKVGVYIPVREGFRNAADDALLSVGGSYDFVQTPGNYTTYVGVYLDSAFKTGSGDKGSVTGVGAQTRTYFGAGGHGNGGTYFLVGLGGYYQYARSSGSATSDWRFGGKLGLGLDAGSRLFFEAAYTAIDGGKIDADGLGLFVGLRF